MSDNIILIGMPGVGKSTAGVVALIASEPAQVGKFYPKKR